MKRLALLCVAMIFFMASFSATPFSIKLEANEIDKFGIGVGLGFGFFYPSDVNDWLDFHYSNYYMEFGSTDLFMNEQISFVTTFRPIKLLRFNIMAEAAIGPKIVRINNGGTNFHNFGRYSVGAEAYLNVPIGSGRHSMLFGVGSLFHHMYFEDYSANTVGLRVIPFGMSFQLGNFQPQVLVGGDLLTNATDGYFELNYNGGFIHINLLF